MTKEEAIKQLKDLLIDSKKFVSIEPTKEDVQAMEIIIKELERTAQEVPVQEQSEHLHKLSIIGEDVIKLDNFQLKGVCKYDLSKSAENKTSILDIRIAIDNSKTVF